MVDESYDQLLIALIQNGYSPNNLRNTLTQLNLNCSTKEIESITEELKNRYYDFVQKQLPSNVFGLYIDAYLSYPFQKKHHPEYVSIRCQEL